MGNCLHRYICVSYFVIKIRFKIYEMKGEENLLIPIISNVDFSSLILL